MKRYVSLRNRPSRKIIIGTLLVVALIGVWLLVRSSISASSRTSGSGNITVSPSKYSVDISREFQFPILDTEGSEVSKIKYFIKHAELRDELIVQGQKVTAIKGRLFLVLSIKLTNELDSDIEINSRDYVRLQINGSTEHMAADIHNDPVHVAAIATKETRIAFPVDDNLTQSFVLRVGEIKGYKEEVPVSFN